MSGALMVCAREVFRTEAKAKAAIAAKSGFRWKRDTGTSRGKNLTAWWAAVGLGWANFVLETSEEIEVPSGIVSTGRQTYSRNRCRCLSNENVKLQCNSPLC